MGRHTAVLLAALCLALAACGDDEPTARIGDGEVEMTLDDFSLTPQRLRVPAGPTTFTITNRGRIGHNFHVIGRQGEPVAVTTLFPGDTETATADLRPGTYRMRCTVSNHEELGMYGTLVVR